MVKLLFFKRQKARKMKMHFVGIPLSIFLLFAAFSASAQCGCTDFIK
ncbi:MAG: hypothetical protein U5L45_00900 [Saprospiraceae bacterium]|nr:hypothetical protein [Saprospiraceae bacterium]